MFSIVSITIIFILVVALSIIIYMYNKEKQKGEKYKQGIIAQKEYLQNMSHECHLRFLSDSVQ